MITFKLVIVTFLMHLAPKNADVCRYDPATHMKTIECSGVAVCTDTCEVTLWECDMPVPMDTCLDTGEVWAYDDHVDAEERGGEHSAIVLGCSTASAESGPWPSKVDVDADALRSLEVK